MVLGPEYLSQSINSHRPYAPGIQPSIGEEMVKLNTNENPYPPSPSVREAVLSELDFLRLYPNSSSDSLRDYLSGLHGLKAEQVIIGNGSDDILNLCTRCFSDSNLKVGMLEPSYSLYEVLASLQGSSLIRVPFQNDAFSIEPEAIIHSGANLFFITSPHAPSGREYAKDCFRQILDAFDGILVIDEAYVDFASQDSLVLLEEYQNLIITRTLSKSYSLAGLRVGYALASPDLVSILDQAREVYNVDRLAQAAALACLRDRSYFEQTREEILKERKRIASLLDEWDWKTCASGANFVFTRPIDSKGKTGREVATDLYDYLMSKNVLIRYFPQHELTSPYVRISIGNPGDMNILLERLIEWKTQEQL
jgi:histidinol-phosphate aminotransferase